MNDELENIWKVVAQSGYYPGEVSEEYVASIFRAE
jgi:hypothetical protein